MGDVSLSSSDLEMSRSHQGCYAEQLAGLRFQGVTIDPGTTIVSAVIEFTVDVGNLGLPGVNDPASLTISGQEHANPPTFVSNGVDNPSYDISGRDYLSTTETWNPEVWTASPGVYQTADISTIVQLIVDLPGWASGNAMAFKIDGPSSNPGFRTANSFNSGLNPPKLIILTGVTRKRMLTCSLATPLLASILRSNFTGASGPVSFGNEHKNGRNSEGITVGIYNVIPHSTDPLPGNRTYETSMVSTWNESFGLVYRDGSAYPTGVLRYFLFQNYIWFSSRVIGLSLMGFAWLLALLSFVLVRWLCNDPAIQRAQPFFMQILCLGSIITSATIFALSWDEDAGWTNHQLSIACSLTPWLFFIGHSLTFGAMFVKLWRVDRFFHFEQQAVAVGYAGTVQTNTKCFELFENEMLSSC